MVNGGVNGATYVKKNTPGLKWPGVQVDFTLAGKGLKPLEKFRI
jgi:hypothetical protein